MSEEHKDPFEADRARIEKEAQARENLHQNLKVQGKPLPDQGSLENAQPVPELDEEGNPVMRSQNTTTSSERDMNSPNS